VYAVLWRRVRGSEPGQDLEPNLLDEWAVDDEVVHGLKASQRTQRGLLGRSRLSRFSFQKWNLTLQGAHVFQVSSHVADDGSLE
jgi:hypothetical protein